MRPVVGDRFGLAFTNETPGSMRRIFLTKRYDAMGI